MPWQSTELRHDQSWFDWHLWGWIPVKRLTDFKLACRLNCAFTLSTCYCDSLCAFLILHLLLQLLSFRMLFSISPVCEVALGACSLPPCSLMSHLLAVKLTLSLLNVSHLLCKLFLLKNQDCQVIIVYKKIIKIYFLKDKQWNAIKGYLYINCPQV